MKQSRLMSMIETAVSTATGFGLSLLLQWLVLSWLLSVSIPLHTNLAFAAVMTAASLLRGFVLRRIFEALHIRRPISPFMQAVIAERFRQIEQEGWSTDHDDAHDAGELARAGGCYAIAAGADDGGERFGVDWIWPWSWDWWKPTAFRRDLVKAGALIIAEGEKFDRNRKRKAGAL